MPPSARSASWAVHRARRGLLCIQSGDSLKNPNHWRFETNEFFFKTPGGYYYCASINCVAEKYGRDRMAQIITFSTIAALAAIREMGSKPRLLHRASERSLPTSPVSSTVGDLEMA